MFRNLFSVVLLAISLFIADISRVNAASFKLDKTRIVLDQQTRRDEIRIYNDSDTLQSFKVTLIEMTMTEEGNLKVIDEYPLSAKPYLRVGPRISRDVPPNSFQKVRIIKKKSPAAGEYRSHLLVESLTADPVKQVKGVFIQPNVKYVIPVFIKQQQESAKIAFGKGQFKENKLVLNLQRQGQGSVSGNLVVSNAQQQELFRADQISIYPELEQRSLHTSLSAQELQGQTLFLSFEDPQQDNKVVLREPLNF